MDGNDDRMEKNIILFNDFKVIYLYLKFWL